MSYKDRFAYVTWLGSFQLDLRPVERVQRLVRWRSQEEESLVRRNGQWHSDSGTLVVELVLADLFTFCLIEHTQTQFTSHAFNFCL